VSRTRHYHRTSKRDGAYVAIFLAICALSFSLTWPWIFNWPLWLEILISCVWYPLLFTPTLLAFRSIIIRKRRKREALPKTEFERGSAAQMPWRKVGVDDPAEAGELATCGSSPEAQANVNRARSKKAMDDARAAQIKGPGRQLCPSWDRRVDLLGRCACCD
jgi:hypothetical protein